MISVVVPTYDREDAVYCCLAGLRTQTFKDFQIIIVDDSEHRECEVAADCSMINWPNSKILCASPPRTGSFTAGRARNFGVANADGDFVVFVDQDVILAPDALAHYKEAHERHPEAIIAGLYHWMRPIKFGHGDILAGLFTEVAASGLGHSTAFPELPMGEPGLMGPDLREKDFSDDINALVDDAALGSWTGNIGYPRDLFIRLGGFDEHIRGHGGEDADLGLTAKEAGAKWLLYNRIWGVHRWHDRNQAQNTKEVQANIAYIDKKHGIEKYPDAQRFGIDAKDWADWQHYQKSVGGVLIQEAGDPTVYVTKEGHALGLPDPSWFKRLGFGFNETLMIPQGTLQSYTVEGACQ